jgi:preflagellin peptidase FlaK
MIEFFIGNNMIGVWLALVMLSLASFIDMKKREIHDYYWIVFGIAGIVLLFLHFDMYYLLDVGLALIVAPFAILVWRLGLFGGADAFAIIVLAVLAPMATFTENLVSPFTTLANAAILFVIPLAVNMIRNLISLVRRQNIFEGFDENYMKKAAAMFIGYRVKNPKFSFSMEKLEGGKKKLNLAMYNVENEPYCTTPNTWITPGIPYILLITGGFVIQLLHGDIILSMLIR